ncbi:unnamed protein product [Paramecium octaurelia]|uniref:Uncharacterized protein n=1 Tax=Paramecium octaurelia TaxID=43137 RepID=A0A8S1XCD6_PAROT|nr:unnamed protein product [Paramecium octaurelia]
MKYFLNWMKKNQEEQHFNTSWAFQIRIKLNQRKRMLLEEFTESMIKATKDTSLYKISDKLCIKIQKRILMKKYWLKSLERLTLIKMEK